ncbi:2-methylcitrate dehydratase [Saccharopolyspora karakumensis]|uniref:2-methylcitrate dehydratase n=1 Tax=Saccharopolyspora karakumensis TaxID=2530386 RepID=A0A4R5C1J2_9PSEU|nr:2-methylcitrate dehydratase [Saccharopolyspora karakumensis]
MAVRLARWAGGLQPTAEDLALAERSLRDTVAVAVAARGHDVLEVARALGEAGRWATASHVIDYDDLHMESTTHISTVCVPVALATGGGARAYLAGAGVMARLGMSLGWRHYSSGWHATTTAGALAAAVVAGVARGLDADGLARAMALAVPAAGGVQRAFGTDAKSLQVGQAADAGVRAAGLAASGATADTGAVEDWLRLLGGDPAVVDVSGPAVPGGLAVKIYPACYALQRPITAMREAVRGVSVDPAAVRRIEVHTPAATVQPLIHHRPTDGLQGKFSLEYAVATALLDERHGFEEFGDEAVRRPEARRLVDLVDTVLEDSGDWLLAGTVRVVVHTDEECHEASLQFPPGSPQRPPTHDELGEKVALCLDGSDVPADEITWAGSAQVLHRTLSLGLPRPTRIAGAASSSSTTCRCPAVPAAQRH